MKTVAVIPAYEAEETIAHTVQALLGDPRIARVIVADDGSTDATAARAGLAGALVVSLPSNAGMGAAIEAGFDAAPDGDVVLIVDADTGSSARSAIDLTDPVRAGEADVAIGILPPAGTRGGFGLVRRVAGWLIYLSSGYRSRAPLSGQRAVRRSVFEACRPLAPRYGANPAFSADSARLGFKIVERPVEMTHDHRGRGVAGFLHRARQGWDLLRCLVPRVVGKRPGAAPDAGVPR